VENPPSRHLGNDMKWIFSLYCVEDQLPGTCLSVRILTCPVLKIETTGESDLFVNPSVLCVFRSEILNWEIPILLETPEIDRETASLGGGYDNNTPTEIEGILIDPLSWNMKNEENTKYEIRKHRNIKYQRHQDINISIYQLNISHQLTVV
jgi:hypothetical protein